MNKKYVKGVAFEREIVEKFTKEGFIAMRIAGSGRYSELLPDVVVMKNGITAVFQCKKTKKNKIYPSKTIENLKKFKEIANVKCFLAVKFNKKDARFYEIEKISEKSISLESNFLTYEEVIKKL